MKKFLLFLVSVIIMTTLIGCEETAIAPLDPIITESPAEAEKTPAPAQPRTVDLSQGILNDGQSFSHSFDFDFDGTAEAINLTAFPSSDSSEGCLAVTIGKKTTRLELWEGSIHKVYACDIDTNDGAYDLAIITVEQSDDPRIRILSYGGNLAPYSFLTSYGYGEEKKVENDLWLGYACSFYFGVNNDDTITLEEQTDSAGMWSVHKTYKRNTTGTFEEIRPEKYKILPDFMENDGHWNEALTENERVMWEKGYVMAHTAYYYDGLSISPGEFFKVLYDDGNDLIYIEKENGESGWMNVSYDFFVDRHEFNPAYFFLAG